jgi:stage III sporulation protein AC
MKIQGVKMDINFIFKIAAIGIIVAVLNQILVRSGREEHAMIITIAGLIVVLMMIIPQIAELFSAVKSIFDL